ncbi:MAG: hypothetical protein LBD95_06595 [Clostridiales Family XIII bacterium]|jgi:hypothetical protein|nr:hypothetical protein [Clostridiales Family XIII bacterium]
MISILLLNSDREYAALLAQRLAAAGSEFSVRVEAPSRGALAEGSHAAAYDFVILDEAAAAEASCPAEAFGGAQPILLTEAAPPPGGAHEGTPGGARERLYASRYGRVSSLAALIRAAYAVRPGNGGLPMRFGGSVKYIGCVGLGGGCGATSIALGIGRDFAAHRGRRALYVSLEALEAEGFCMRKAEGERHIGDFLYLLLRGREADLRLFCEACLFRDGYGLARFFPSPGLNDLARASPEEIGDFLRFLDACACFDSVVLDLGGTCGEAALRIARLCDALVLVENGALADAGKRDRATALLRAAWCGDGAAPIFVKNLLRFSYDADEDAEGAPDEDARPAPDREGIEIGYDGASFRYVDGVTDFVLSGEFGQGIHRLTDSLLARICERKGA